MRKTSGGTLVPINIVGGSTYGRHAKISSARTFDMFISDNWLVNTAGYKKILQFLPPGNGVTGRGIYRSVRKNILIVVSAGFVYQIDQNLIITTIGSLNTESGEVFIAENLNSQICIVDGLNAYIYNYDSAPNLTVQTGGAFASGNLIPNYVEFHNNFFLFGNANRTPNGSAWYVYAYASATTITQVANGGQFAIQTKPDLALAVVRLPGQGNNVLAMGASVCEIWTNVGGLQNYLRNPTINVDYGVASVSTIARSDQYVAWLGINERNGPVILVYTGQGVQVISSDGIDYELERIQFPAQSTAMFYRQDGHLFYQLTFFNPVDNKTYLYDFQTEKFFDLRDANLNFHPARDYAYFNNNTYFVSLLNASLYQSSTDFTTYNENLPTAVQDPTQNLEIQHIRICDTIMAPDGSSQFRPNTFFFTLEQGNDPNVTGISLNNLNLIAAEGGFVVPNAIIYTEFGIPIALEGSGIGADDVNLPAPYQPRVDMSISRDGGISWSNTVGRNLNPVGYRQNILNWENLGMTNYLTIKLRFWGLSRFVVNKGNIEVY